ncbi:MAG: DNA polymerase III subunit gamma/tau [Halothiobacillaceae bacterium]
MSYTVLARKWRPKRFADMVGQTHVLQALVNALDNGRLHHAYLFTGTRGIGKTTIARILAKSLNCEQGLGSQPCGECATCLEIDEGRYVDMIEVDAASRTRVEETRELLANVPYMPVRGRYKVYLIDEVHMFSGSSFNALLKTLEEPPEHVKFVLATTDPQKLPVTVLSRCLQFNLRPLTALQIGNHLAQVLEQEAVPFERPALDALADAADGSMRDALSLLDQAIAYGGGQVGRQGVVDMLGLTDEEALVTIVERLQREEAAELFESLGSLMAQAADPAGILAQLLELLHGLSIRQFVPGSGMPEDPLDERRRALAESLDPELLQLWYQIALTGRRDLPHASSPRAGLEMTLLRMLAFTPGAGGAGGGAPAARPAPASGRLPAAPARSSPAPAATPQAGSGESEPAGAVSSQAGGRDPSAGQEEPAGADQPTGAGDDRPAESRWAAIIPQLGLRGPFQSLAEHCIIRERNADGVVLELAADQSGMLTDRTRSRLIEATEAYFGCRVRLVVGREGEAAPAAPAKQRVMREAAQRDRARAALESSPGVQVLKAGADATLIDGTLQLAGPDARASGGEVPSPKTSSG